MFDKEAEDRTDILAIAVKLAAGILSGSGVSHKDTKTVSVLAIQHARALVEQIKVSEIEEKNRIETEQRQAKLDKAAAEAAAAEEKQKAHDEEEARKKLEKSHK